MYWFTFQELAHILRIKTVNSQATSDTHAEIAEEALESCKAILSLSCFFLLFDFFNL